MAEHAETTRAETVKEVSPDGRTARTTEYIERPLAGAAYKQTIAERLIWYIAGILLVLLAFRFVLALLGANPSNGFADFIYTVSHPFVAPFFSLFGYNLRYGISHFEIFTLVAMAVYAVIAYGLARLATLTRPAR